MTQNRRAGLIPVCSKIELYYSAKFFPPLEHHPLDQDVSIFEMNEDPETKAKVTIEMWGSFFYSSGINDTREIQVSYNRQTDR